MGSVETSPPMEVILPKMSPLIATHHNHQIIRKKSSLASKLRKVFVTKGTSTPKDLTDDELSPFPSAPHSQPSSSPYSLEDIIADSQDNELGSLGFLSKDENLPALGSRLLVQPEHRGSVSSTSSADTTASTSDFKGLDLDLHCTPLTSPEISPFNSPQLKASTLPAEHPLSCTELTDNTTFHATIHNSVDVLPSQHPLCASPATDALPSLPSQNPVAPLSILTSPAALMPKTELLQDQTPTSTRAAKKRISFATITAFFQPRHDGCQEIKKKQQRSASVPNVEHPAAVNSQMAGFQRRHSLNDMHPNAPSAARHGGMIASSLPSSPQGFVVPPWEKDLASAQALYASSEAMDEVKVLPKAKTTTPSRRFRSVFGRRAGKNKKNVIVATGAIPSSPSFTSLAVTGNQSSVGSHVASAGKALRPALVHRVHRAPSVRAPSVRAPSIRAPSIRAPSVRAPSIRAPSVRRAPSIRSPSIRAPSIRNHGHHRAPSMHQQDFGRRISSEHSSGRSSLERATTLRNHHRENNIAGGRLAKRPTIRNSSAPSLRSTADEYDFCATPLASLEEQVESNTGVPKRQLKTLSQAPRVKPIITKGLPPVANTASTLSPTSSYSSINSGSADSMSTIDSTPQQVHTPKQSSKRLSFHGDIPRRSSVDQSSPGCSLFHSGSSTAYSNSSAASSNVSSTATAYSYSGSASPTQITAPKMFSFPPQNVQQQQQQHFSQFQQQVFQHPMAEHPYHQPYNVHQHMMNAPPGFNPAYPPPAPHYQYQQQQQQQQQQQEMSSSGQYSFQYPPHLQQQQHSLPLLHFHHPLQPATPEYQYLPMPHQIASPPPPMPMGPRGQPQLQQQQQQYQFPPPSHYQNGYSQLPQRPQTPVRTLSPPMTPTTPGGGGGCGRTQKIQFSMVGPQVHQTYAADQYDRSSDPHITAQRLTPAIAHKIKVELNQFKSQEMQVHHESRINTHFFV
ncbi:hypothetical protein BG004_004764 [Podila humilis]|nr:hypothetical protein BG004_004764 [Podila humilis]